MMYKIGVIGDKDSILPFKMIGFSIADCRDPQMARQQIDEWAKEHYGIIYVTEQIAQHIPDTLQHYQQLPTPAVILIPNYKGSLNIGMQTIQNNVEKAIGQNILS